ncbi:MAG: cytochrome c oxidase subunit II [Cytophagales bacterium]|nr:MAG: cytochrome c oxidase subunit II [Cytophagales bacterium]TAF60492.1 MAG: cytochrome c oxidase subunit II [Cytophagales bacterium]
MMFYVILILGVIVFVGLLGFIYRVFALVNLSKTSGENYERRTGKSAAVNGLSLIIFFVVGMVAIFWYSDAVKIHYLPEASSAHGSSIDNLFWITTIVVFIAFALVNALLLSFPFIYRFKDNRKAYFYADNHKLEIVWTVVPAIVLTVLVLMGWNVWSSVTAPAPTGSLEIEVIGKQFNWMVRYAGKDGKLGRHDFRQIDDDNAIGMDFKKDFKTNADDFTASELKLPKGQNVLLKIRSRDVLHSVFLPHFRVKMDAVPGMPTSFWFMPTKTTEEMRAQLSKEGRPNAAEFDYILTCTEVCGNSHFAMKMKVSVLEKAEFDKWYAEQEPWAVKNKEYLQKKGINVGGLALNK